MGKKIYVNGGILITTPYFAYRGAGARYGYMDDAEIVEVNAITEDGEPYLEISDEHPQSIFNEYYAKTFFTTLHGIASYFRTSYFESYDILRDKLNEVKDVINDISKFSKEKQYIFYRMCYINIVASLDTFICDIIISKIIQDENLFSSYAEQFCKNCKKNNAEESEDIGRWEQEIIDAIMRTSYGNIDTIKDVLKFLFQISVTDFNGKIKQHFRNRNNFAHRNGRKKDGSYITITKDDILTLIFDVKSFAKQIISQINPEK